MPPIINVILSCNASYTIVRGIYVKMSPVITTIANVLVVYMLGRRHL